MLAHELIESIKAKYLGAYQAYMRSIVGALYASVSTMSVSSSREFKSLVEESRLRLLAEVRTLESDVRRVVIATPFPRAEEVFEIDEFIASLAKETMDLFAHQSSRDAAQVKHILVELRMGVSIDLGQDDDYRRLERIHRCVEERLRTWARNGTRWKSERFVDVAVNHALTRAYNESVLFLARARGFGRFRGEYPDGRVTRSFLLPDYQSGRLSRIFHPRTSALVDVDI